MTYYRSHACLHLQILRYYCVNANVLDVSPCYSIEIFSHLILSWRFVLLKLVLSQAEGGARFMCSCVMPSTGMALYLDKFASLPSIYEGKNSRRKDTS
ncbi:unnamed protein product [Periconia digitata]|uniref:Uncharacterized protein n=1 Tax=Periconia digitata TaxID=1303443 RepID=A0A9W4U5J7_9PLEO|nr:unnamed protein product [Periconia digitata]